MAGSFQGSPWRACCVGKLQHSGLFVRRVLWCGLLWVGGGPAILIGSRHSCTLMQQRMLLCHRVLLVLLPRKGRLLCVCAYACAAVVALHCSLCIVGCCLVLLLRVCKAFAGRAVHGRAVHVHCHVACVGSCRNTVYMQPAEPCVHHR
jgi:hypothetical protein